MTTYLYYFPACETLEFIHYSFIYKILEGLFLCQVIPSLLYFVVLSLSAGQP